jgi:prepilin-type N-terminal cleavage/methylation domain-containing protein
MKMKRHGFSMIEMMIAIVIFGILVIVGVPIMTSALAEYRLNNATQILSTAIQKARYMASSNNRTFVVQVSVGNPTRIQVFMDVDGDFAWGAQDQAEEYRIQHPTDSQGGHLEEVQFVGSTTMTLPDDVSFTQVDFGTYTNAPANVLAFGPDGQLWTPTSGSTIYVRPTTPDPWSSPGNIYTPKIRLETTMMGSTTQYWVGISKFGEVTRHDL